MGKIFALLFLHFFSTGEHRDPEICQSTGKGKDHIVGNQITLITDFNIIKSTLNATYSVADRDSEETKHQRGTALFTNNTVPFQCFDSSGSQCATAHTDF